jgi:hypothetical protein
VCERLRQPVEERGVVQSAAQVLAQRGDLAGVRLGGGEVTGVGGSLGVLAADLAASQREQDRQEDRGAQRAADGAEERRGGRGDAHVLGGHGVLHGEDEALHVQAESDAEDRHEDVGMPQRRVGAEGGQQAHADEHEHRADDGEDLVAAGTGDQPPGAEGGEHQPGDHRQQEQAGLRR